LAILTKILLGNVCWLALIIIGEFNDHFKSGLGFKIRHLYFNLPFTQENSKKTNNLC
jgi:hypothetical protein